MTQRRRYSKEFKHEAVELARSPSTSIRQVALELGLNPNRLARWKREADRDDTPAFQGSGTARDQELAAVRRELVRVKKERDFYATRQRSSPGSRPEIPDDLALSQ